MNLDKRIVYSADEMLQSVESALEKMNVLRYDSQYRLLLGDTLIGRLNAWDENIRKRKKDPFTVVVIGDFKRGKSTFINALLGEEVVTTDVTTETVTFNHIRYGNHSNEAVLSANRRLRLLDAELKKEELERVISQTGEPVVNLEIRRTCEILKDITIIDTPGTGDAMKDFSSQVEECLLQADAVIYLYSVKYPLSHTEQIFLKTAVLPQQYTKLFLIGNYADTMENEHDYQRIRNVAEERVHSLLPEAEILTISALDELCRRLKLERPCENLKQILEEQFQRFRDILNQLITDKRETVIVDRMQRLTGAMIHELDEELMLLEEGLSMSSEEARRHLDDLQMQKQKSVEKQEELTRRINFIIAGMKSEAGRWMMDFIESLRKETEHLGEVSTDDLFKYYSFYILDMMQRAINICLEYHTEQIYEELEEISGALAKDLAGSFSTDGGYHFRFHLDNKVWTKGDNIGLAVSMVGASGTLATIASLAVDAFTGVMRQSEVEMKKPEVIKRILTQMRGVENTVSSTISELYEKLGENARKSILEFYADETKKAEHFVEQFVSVANSEEQDKGNIRAAVDSARTILKEASEKVSLTI